MTMWKKEDRPLHKKDRFFLASKEVGLPLDICPLGKGLLQNVYWMLDLFS